MSKTMTFRFTEKHAQNELFGAVNYTVTETLTERDGGLLVESHALGVCEGDRVDQKSSKFHPGATLERAAAYRLSHGYELVSAKECAA